MPDLEFRINGASVVPHSASPLLALQMEIGNSGGEPIHTVVLRCQIQIETTRRKYNEGDPHHLLDLFGEPERWGQTMRSMLWTHTGLVVPQFIGKTVVDLPVPCTFDFNVAATKYFYALEDGEVPLCLLFSGTIFYVSDEGYMQV